MSLQTQTAGDGRALRHHDPNIRERLVEAAVELFTRRGYSATSVREIVEGAGVSKPVLYYHFGSKEGLYLEIARRLERTVSDTVASRDAGGGTARERIRRLALDIYDAFSENTAAVRFLNAVFWGPPQGTPEFDVDVPSPSADRRVPGARGEGSSGASSGGGRPGSVVRRPRRAQLRHGFPSRASRPLARAGGSREGSRPRPVRGPPRPGAEDPADETVPTASDPRPPAPSARRPGLLARGERHGGVRETCRGRGGGGGRLRRAEGGGRGRRNPRPEVPGGGEERVQRDGLRGLRHRVGPRGQGNAPLPLRLARGRGRGAGGPGERPSPPRSARAAPGASGNGARG